MKILNIDLHVGAKDFQCIAKELGHDVDVWSISDHHKIHNWDRAKVDIVNQNTWKNLNEKMCDDFYNRYKEEFQKYDCFYCFYSPAFALLYEKFGKPIIIQAPLRYEVPFSNNPHMWQVLNNFLRVGIDSGQIFPIVTNKYDAKYLKLFTNRDWQLIPNLCEYTNAKYTGSRNEFLYCSKFKDFKNWIGLPNIVDKSEIRGHSWQDVANYIAHIYMPYSNTLTTTFETFTSNIPTLFPTKEFLSGMWALYRHTGVMSELSFQQVNGHIPRTLIEFDKNTPDPNDYDSPETFQHWIHYHDFYDSEYFPYTLHYESIGHLEELLMTTDFNEVSQNIKNFNVGRRKKIMDKWQAVLNNVEKKYAL